MIITGQTVDGDLVTIEKSIANNLKNKDLFTAEKEDTADNTIELKPPIPMNDCLYVFQNSSHVAKSCRILAADVIYNTITLTPVQGDADGHLINQVMKINDYLNENIDELYNLLVDYNYAGWGAIEYTWTNTKFSLRQIPIHTCTIIRITENGQNLYLLRQKINSLTKYFKIMGEKYPEDFLYYAGEKLSYASLIGGDNIYEFFSMPRWIQNHPKILTEIAISRSNYQTISNGNISSGILNINLEPQLPQPQLPPQQLPPQQLLQRQLDDNGKPVKQKSREEIISNELQQANGGTAVIFTESNRPVNLDYISLANGNASYLSDLSKECEQAVFNDYNIPLVRMMINTEKESMNSDKTKSIWEIYGLNLKNEQKIPKLFLKELVYELYNIPVNVDITLPIFSDRREIETKLLSQAWNDGALTLKQYITALSEYLNVIDLNDYDFTVNQDIWNYRKLPELEASMSAEDEEIIRQIEAQLNEA